MLDSGVPDIALEPDKTVQKVVIFVSPTVPHILFTSFLAYLSSSLSFLSPPPPPLSLSLSQGKAKFRLEMSEEQAVQYLQNLIDDNIKAVFPEMFERILQY